VALSDRYAAQVALLVEVLPFVAEEPDFALKGGTAINLLRVPTMADRDSD
jgi:hypothetical protein